MCANLHLFPAHKPLLLHRAIAIGFFLVAFGACVVLLTTKLVDKRINPSLRPVVAPGIPISDPTLGKYTMKERFGVGFPTQSYSLVDGKVVNKARSIDELPRKAIQHLGVGWYYDWSDGRLSDGVVGGARENLQYMGFAGAYGSTRNSPPRIDSPTCQTLRAHITANRDKFPDGMDWVIGNEMGLDDGKLTAVEYSRHFVNWKRCLKSISTTFRVGSGAISQLLKSTPDPVGTPHCVAYDAPNSGANYFRAYVKEIKRYDPDSLPDFYANNGYTYCIEQLNPVKPVTSEAHWASVENTVDIDVFKWQIQEYRRIMKELGEQNKDLVIREWGPFNIQVGFENRQRHLRETIDYMAIATDPQLGSPDDAHRLVQKWSFTMAASMPNAHLAPIGWFKTLYQHTSLMDGVTGELTPMGDLYKRLISKYTNIADSVDRRFGLSGGGGMLSSLDMTTYHGWGNSGAGSGSSTKYGEVSYFKGGIDTNLLVGKIDDPGYTDLNFPAQPGLSLYFDWNNSKSFFWDGHPKCKHKTSNEIVNCIDHINDGNYVPHTRTYDAIDSMFADASARGVDLSARVWEIANEPDAIPYIIPEDYAVWYKLFSDKIRSRDPKAKIMIGGLLTAANSRISAWVAVNACQNRGSAPNVDCQATADPTNWIRRFRDSYRGFYGEYPQVDIWNLHPYTLEMYHQSNPTRNVEEVTQNLSSFRTFLENLPSTDRISEQNKPIYLTEYGSLAGEGQTIRSQFDAQGNIQSASSCDKHCCLTIDEQTQEWNTLSKFVTDLHTWLATTDIAQRWYWFSPEHNANYTSLSEGRDRLNFLPVMSRLSGYLKLDPTPIPLPTNTPIVTPTSYPTSVTEPDDRGIGRPIEAQPKLRVTGFTPDAEVMGVSTGVAISLDIGGRGNSKQSVDRDFGLQSEATVQSSPFTLSACYPEYSTPDSSYNPIVIAYAQSAKATKILNPSFESPNYSDYGWKFLRGEDNKATAVIDSGEKRSGNRSLRVDFEGNRNSSILYEIPSRYFAGKNVDFSLYVKTEKGAKAWAKISYTNTDNERYTSYEPSFINPAEYPTWTKIEKKQIPIPIDAVKLEFEGMGTGSGQGSKVWFDDFAFNVSIPSPTATPIPTLSPTPEVPACPHLSYPIQILKDPSFNSSDQWPIWTQNGNRLEISNGQARMYGPANGNTGRGCFKQTISLASGHGDYSLVGKTVRISSLVSRNTALGVGQNPYIGLNVNEGDTPPSRKYNYGDIVSLPAHSNEGVISRDIYLKPQDQIHSLTLNVCSWNIPASTLSSQWASMCIVAENDIVPLSPTPIPPTRIPPSVTPTPRACQGVFRPIISLTTTQQCPRSNVLISWTTNNESNTLGFDVTRKNNATGLSSKVNTQLIFADNSGSNMGSQYAITDSSILSGLFTYNLQVYTTQGCVYNGPSQTIQTFSQCISPTRTLSPTRTPTSITRQTTPSRAPSTSVAPTRSPSPSRTPSVTRTPTPTRTPTLTRTPTPTQVVCQDRIVSCSKGKQYLSNPTFESGSYPWNPWNGKLTSPFFGNKKLIINSLPSPTPTRSLTPGITNIPVPGGQSMGCWTQELTQLAGKTITLSAEMFRSQNIGNAAPYIGINIYPKQGKGGLLYEWHNNFDGIASLTEVNKCSIKSKVIAVPNYVQKVRVFFCVWNATPGRSELSWISVCDK